MTYFNLDGFMASGGRGGMAVSAARGDVQVMAVARRGAGNRHVDRGWPPSHFSDANLRWKEEQTKRRIIYPVLTNFLGFSALDLSETMDPGLR